MVRFRVDISQFKRENEKLCKHDFPTAFAAGLTNAAQHLQTFEKANLRQTFHLHTEWWPNNILSFPNTRPQVRRLIRDLATKKSGFVSVFSSKWVSWLGIHEEGGTRYPHSYGRVGDSGKKLTVPVNSDGKSLKTPTGKTRKSYQPFELLKESQNPWNKGSKHPGERGTGKRRPFIIRSASGSYLVRRRRGSTKGLEVFYKFIDSGRIKKTWRFEERGLIWCSMMVPRYIHNGMTRFFQGFNAK